MRKMLLIFIACMITPFYSSQAQEAERDIRVLRSASEYDYPPFSIVHSDGTVDGFSVDLLKAVAEVSGFSVTFSSGPWHEIKEQLRQGTLDVLPLVSYSGDRNNYFDFTIPYITLNGTIVVRKNNDSIKTEADLKGKEVLVMRGDTAHEYAVKNNITDKLVLTDTYTDAMRMLSEGKYDAVIVQTIVGLRLINSLGLNNLKMLGNKPIFKDEFKPTKQTLDGFEQKFCFAVRAGDTKLLSRLNEGLLIIFENGTYDKIFEKWFSPLIPVRIPLEKFLFYLTAIMLPALLIFAGMGIWFLKRQVAQKTADLTIQKQEYMMLVENQTDLIVKYDRRAVLLFVNSPFCEVFSVKEADICGKSFLSLMSAHERSEFEMFLKHIDKPPYSFYHEKQMLTSQGLRWFGWSNKGAVDSAGRVTEIMAVGRDITERKTLQQERDRLFNYALDMICIATFDGHFKRLNPAWNRVLGWSNEELIAKPWIEFVHPDDKNATLQIGQDLIAGKPVIEFENRYLCKDGSYKWLSWNSFPLKEENTIFAVTRDISFRKETELALQQSEIRYRELCDNLKSGVVVYRAENDGENFVILNFNKGAELIENIKRETIVGKYVTEAFPGVVEFGIFDIFKRVWKTGVPEYFPSKLYVDNKISGWRENYVYKLPSGEIVAVYEDTTEQKKYEQEREKLLKQLQSKNEELESIIYVTSHDLRAPLVNISAYVSELSDCFKKIHNMHRDNSMPEKEIDNIINDMTLFVSILTSSTDKMANLLKGLLQVCRLGRQEPQLTLENMNLLIDNIVTSLSYQLKEAKAKVELDELPNCMVDKQLISQVFSNLLENAVKYRDPNRNLVIKIRAEIQNSEILFCIEDNGMGIDKPYHERIFHIFHQLHVKSHPDGEGLGLTIVRRIVEMHNGRIWVESAQGVGSSFKFTVPV